MLPPSPRSPTSSAVAVSPPETQADPGFCPGYQAVLQAHAWMGDLQTLTAARAPARVNIESALRDFATAAASLRGLANDVEHNPQLLLTGRRP